MTQPNKELNFGIRKDFIRHRHHYAEKVLTWKDGTYFLLKRCKCGVHRFFSTIPHQICKQCGKTFETNEEIYFTVEMDFFRCKTCLTQILGEAFKKAFEED